MDKKRYLLALLVAGAEGGAIFGGAEILRGSVSSAAGGFAVALVSSLSAYWNSIHTRAHARTMFPKARPPSSWIVSFVCIGILSFVVGTFFILDASDGGGIVHTILRTVEALWVSLY